MEDMQATPQTGSELYSFARGAIASLFATDEWMVVYIELCLPHLIEVALAIGSDDLFLLAVRSDDEIRLAEDALQRVLIIHEHVTRR